MAKVRVSNSEVFKAVEKIFPHISFQSYPLGSVELEGELVTDTAFKEEYISCKAGCYHDAHFSCECKCHSIFEKFYAQSPKDIEKLGPSQNPFLDSRNKINEIIDVLNTMRHEM